MRYAAQSMILAMLATGGAASVSADNRSGDLVITKECSQYTGAAGAFCTITSSNLPQIKAGSKVYYDQAAGIPEGLVDSNAVLDAGNGNWAMGRCTINGNTKTAVGLCTFSDGTGTLSGFSARVVVYSTDSAGINYRWQGTYSFSPIGFH